MNDISFMLNYLTKRPRAEAIEELARQCQACGVYILDTNMLSNLSMMLKLEGQASEILSFAQSIQKGSFAIDMSSREVLTSLLQAPLGTRAMGTLQVSFTGEDGELRHELPRVPG